MRAAGPAEAAANVPYHDWWVYQLMAGSGAAIITDPQPSLYYRQHKGNILGSNKGLLNSLARLKIATDTRFTDWIDRNTAALGAVRGMLTESACRQLDGLTELRNLSGRKAVTRLERLGIYRQGKVSHRVVRALAYTGRL